jgi:hypothetical protein
MDCRALPCIAPEKDDRIIEVLQVRFPQFDYETLAKAWANAHGCWDEVVAALTAPAGRSQA